MNEHHFTDSQWESWADKLAENNFVILDDFLNPDLLRKTQTFLKSKLEEEEFRKAGIGTLTDFTIDRSIRGDWIYWLDKSRDQEISEFYLLIDELTAQMNKLCYLGALGCEFHLAHYPEGTFYKRHLDQFRERSNRILSVIFYVNESWDVANGGQLRVFNSDDTTCDIAPLPGRMVLLRSDIVEHEVLKTNASRYSVTGWLTKHPIGVSYLG